MIVWARIGYGMVLLLLPDRVLHLVVRQTATKRERVATRILGLRLLAQAAATDVRPNAVSVALGAEVDFVHTLSMLVWAMVDRGSRRLTLLSAVIAGLFGVGGMAQARRMPTTAPTTPAADPLSALVVLRHRIAVPVARYTMPGAVRAWLGI